MAIEPHPVLDELSALKDPPNPASTPPSGTAAAEESVTSAVDASGDSVVSVTAASAGIVVGVSEVAAGIVVTLGDGIVDDAIVDVCACAIEPGAMAKAQKENEMSTADSRLLVWLRLKREPTFSFREMDIVDLFSLQEGCGNQNGSAVVLPCTRNRLELHTSPINGCRFFASRWFETGQSLRGERWARVAPFKENVAPGVRPHVVSAD